MRVAGLLLVIILPSLFLQPAAAQIGNMIQNMQQLREKIVTGGKYTNDQWGVSVDLPSGWRGVTNQTDWYLDLTLVPSGTGIANIPAIIQSNPQNVNFQSISLTVIVKSKEPSKVSIVDPLVSLALSFGCTTKSDAYDIINGINFHSMIKECPKSAPKVELKQYTFDTGTKKYDFWYITKPATNAEFYQYLGVFDNAAQSIQITGYSQQSSQSSSQQSSQQSSSVTFTATIFTIFFTVTFTKDKQLYTRVWLLDTSDPCSLYHKSDCCIKI